MTSTYLGYRLYANDIAKSLQRVAGEPTVAREQSYYEANIGKVTSADQFLNNYKLFNYAMKAYGLSDMGNAKAFMRKVLESDLSDKNSFANRLSDTRYRTFAKAFQFTTKGAVPNAAAAQTSDQQAGTTSLYAAASTASDADQATATAYYKAHIGAVTSVADLEKDDKLYGYVKTAYGLGSSIDTATFNKAIESDLSDGQSFANASGQTAYKQLANDFNFAADGRIATERELQSADDMAATTTAYTAAAGTDAKSKAAAATETSYYESTLPLISTLDGFLSNKRLVAYAEKAYGIPANTTATQLKAILTSDPLDLKSTANKLGSNYRAFAAAFNFTKSGTVGRAANVEAQSKSQVSAVTDAYLEQSMETEAGDQSDGVRLALYFKRVAPTISNAYQILADKALTQVTQTMLGLSASSSNADIDTQARTITSRLKLSDLKDSTKVDKMLARFAALYDLKNTTSSSSSISSLF